jgi:hypothetical protein
MIYEWIDKNVPLQNVAGKTGDFFRSRSFKVTTEEQPGNWVVSAAGHDKEHTYVVFVRIHGTPADFYVEFDRNVQEHLLKFTGTMSLFGFGALARRDLNKLAFLERLEGDFWVCIEEFLSSRLGNELDGVTKA